VVGDLQDPEDAPASVRKDQPDVALVDLSIPDRDLASAIRSMSSARSELKVVVLATPRDRDRILAAVDAGGVGLPAPRVGSEELLSGIRAVARGESPLSLSATLALLGSRGKAALTTRERQILALVARGLANKQIAAAWGISEKTVKTHLGSAFQRLGVSDRTQAALWARGMAF